MDITMWQLKDLIIKELGSYSEEVRRDLHLQYQTLCGNKQPFKSDITYKKSDSSAPRSVLYYDQGILEKAVYICATYTDIDWADK